MWHNGMMPQRLISVERKEPFFLMLHSSMNTLIVALFLWRSKHISVPLKCRASCNGQGSPHPYCLSNATSLLVPFANKRTWFATYMQCRWFEDWCHRVKEVLNPSDSIDAHCEISEILLHFFSKYKLHRFSFSEVFIFLFFFHSCNSSSMNLCIHYLHRAAWLFYCDSLEPEVTEWEDFKDLVRKHSPCQEFLI